MKCTRSIKISCLHSRCGIVKLNRKGSVKMQAPTMCFSFFLSILILSYRVNVICNNKRRMCFLNFFNKNCSAICAWFMDQCTTKDDKRKGRGGPGRHMHQREKKWMRLHTQQDGYWFLLRSACAFRIWLWNMHVHGYLHEGRVTTQHRSRTATLFQAWMPVASGLRRPCLQCALQRSTRFQNLAALFPYVRGSHLTCVFRPAITVK